MNANYNVNPNYRNNNYRNNNYQHSTISHNKYSTNNHNQYSANSQQVMQRLDNLEQQICQLVKLLEVNNELLKGLEQMQNRVITSGGGSVIVRM